MFPPFKVLRFNTKPVSEVLNPINASEAKQTWVLTREFWSLTDEFTGRIPSCSRTKAPKFCTSFCTIWLWMTCTIYSPNSINQKSFPLTKNTDLKSTSQEQQTPTLLGLSPSKSPFTTLTHPLYACALSESKAAKWPFTSKCNSLWKS